MSSLFNLFRSVFEWGLFLALIGGLGEATIYMSKEAATAQTHGLVSLTRLNAQLGGPKRIHQSSATR